MVLAFIITTLTGESPLLLYYQVYGQIVQIQASGDTGSHENGKRSMDREANERQRQLVKQHVLRVSEQVHSEYQFRRETNNLTPEEDIQRLNNDDTLPEFEVGHFRVQKPVFNSGTSSENLTQDSAAGNFHHVTWMGAALTGFVLLCDSCENRNVAGQVLRLLVRFLQEHVRVLSQPSEIMNRVERVAEVLERVLPDGNLLFMNHRAVRQIEKELETVMKTSS